eukprot:gene7237-6827_t
MRIPAIIRCALSLHCADAGSFYVSLDGDDHASGDLAHPFASWGKCLDACSPGDTCFVRRGRYHVDANVTAAGAPGMPVTLAAYPGEQVIVDGTSPVQGQWEQFKTGLWRVQPAFPVSQLWLDGDMMLPARWPNARLQDDEVFNASIALAGATKASTLGHMVDDGAKGLAASGINATGAIGLLNIGSWLTFAEHVTAHIPGTPGFSYSLTGLPSQIAFQPANG